MRHEMLTQRARFLYWRDGKKGHAESAFRDACRTSSAYKSGTGRIVTAINLQFFWNQSFISQNTHFQSSISTQIGFSPNLMASGIA